MNIPVVAMVTLQDQLLQSKMLVEAMQVRTPLVLWSR